MVVKSQLQWFVQTKRLNNAGFVALMTFKFYWNQPKCYSTVQQQFPHLVAIEPLWMQFKFTVYVLLCNDERTSIIQSASAPSQDSQCLQNELFPLFVKRFGLWHVYCCWYCRSVSLLRICPCANSNIDKPMYNAYRAVVKKTVIMIRSKLSDSSACHNSISF